MILHQLVMLTLMVMMVGGFLITSQQLSGMRALNRRILAHVEEPLLQYLKKKLAVLMFGSHHLDAKGISSDVPSFRQISKSFRLVVVKETNFVSVSQSSYNVF
uniref:Uncharacterized protein n=1 Tax=Timema douglasi TaxID=61478 RepID=A0A7R8Z8J5_TIMDO|nr:unnamed protein product [Timema douglasi]